jgi:hypothetical protein
MFSLLTQDDIANNWKTVIKKKKYKEFIESEIKLYELPSHLWKDNKINDNIIIDGPFKYNLVKTDYDEKILQLYNEINKEDKNIILIKELYDYCISLNISSWLLIKAKDIIN